MATRRNKRNLATHKKKNYEENSTSNLAQKTTATKSQEVYINQVFEIEGRITKKLSKEFNKTKSRILGALSQLDEFFLSSLLQGHYGSAPEHLKMRST